MTSRTAQRRKKAAEARRINPESMYGVQPAWCATEDDLEDCRRQSHDMLIRQMGDTRTGGVQWLQYEGEHAKKVLSEMAEGQVGYNADVYRRIGAHLREYGGFLVVAMAEGRGGDGAPADH